MVGTLERVHQIYDAQVTRCKKPNSVESPQAVQAGADFDDVIMEPSRRAEDYDEAK